MVLFLRWGARWNFKIFNFCQIKGVATKSWHSSTFVELNCSCFRLKEDMMRPTIDVKETMQLLAQIKRVVNSGKLGADF